MSLARKALAGLLAALPALAPAQASRLTVEQRLQRVEDELAIHRIIVDYAATLDGRDYAAYAALFAPDGEWSGGGSGATHKGRAAIEKMLSMLGPAGAENNANYHLVSNPRIDLDGDRATATSRYLFVMRGKDGQPTPALAGTYADEFVRIDGEWKIQRRVASDIMPTREEWAKFIAEQRKQ